MDAQARTVSPLEKALYLKRLPALRDLSSEGLSAVAQSTIERSFSKGETLQEFGKPMRSFHLIVEGRVRAQGGEHGAGEVLESGQAVGVLCMIARLEEGLEAVAENDVVTLELSFDDLADVLEDHFELFTNEIRVLAGRLLAVRKRIPDGTYLAPAEGLAHGKSGGYDLVDRLVFMTQGSVFQQSSLEALIEIARGVEEVSFPEGTKLWDIGDPSGFMYAMATGTVRCEVEPGRIFRVGPGYPVGNLESQAGKPRWYDAITETPVRALLARTDMFLDVLEDHFEPALEFLAVMAKGVLRALDQERSGVGPQSQDLPEHEGEGGDPGESNRHRLGFRPFLAPSGAEIPADGELPT